MYAEKFINAFNEGYQVLVNNEIIEEVQYLEEHNDAPTQVGVEKNFTMGTHKVAFLYFNNNDFFNTEDLTSLGLQGRAITKVKFFENKNLTETAYYFDTTLIENSYDEDKSIRKEIEENYDNWNNYSKEFFTYTLNCFDGQHDTLLSGISFDNEKNINSLVCHIYPNADVEKYKSIIEKLCDLYQITTSKRKKSNLDSLIEKISPILSDSNIKLSFEISHAKDNQKEISLIIHPIINDFRHDVVKSTADCLVEVNLLDELSAKQLDVWQPERTVDSNPSHGRLKGYLKIKILSGNKLKIEVLSCYGVV